MKQISRRKFLQISGLAAGATMLPMPVSWLGRLDALAYYQSPMIPLYKNTLRGIGQIPVAAADPTPAPVTGVTHYTLDVVQFQDQLTGGVLGNTTLRGFHPALIKAGPATPAHLGGIIVAERGVPLQITFRNKLPGGKHIIPNDTSIEGANQASNRVAVHIHGGLVSWISDGGPFDWWTPDGTHGLSFLNNAVLNPGAAADEAEYYYGNDQSARMQWYHDHAHGITRINAYAGIATAYFIRDNFERHLQTMGLPQFIEAGGNEIPLVVQDKVFVGSNINLIDPTWKNVVAPIATTPGNLWYPHLYERNRWRKTYSALPVPNPSCIPEMFGDTMLVNGTAFPKVTVEGRRYRLRALNACNARFLNLQLYVADASADGITLDALGNPTNTPFIDGAQNIAAILQIGAEGGFLDKPVQVPTNQPINLANPNVPTGSLIIAPAERADLIIDFSKHVGQDIILYTDCPAPFPGGDPRFDYFPGWNTAQNPVNAYTKKGFGPNTRILMRFHVVAGADATPLAITTTTDFIAEASANSLVWNDPYLVPPGVTTPPANVPVRNLTLNEAFDDFGRLMQLIGTDVVQPGGGYGMAHMATPTEIVSNGATEIWQIANLTADVHPMHFHLVNVQIINRYPINPLAPFAGAAGAVRGPDPNESGWKETVRVYPGEIVTVIMKFTLPEIKNADGTITATPPSPRTGNHEYVWHCHILEHEEHDMMRPLVVV